VFFKGFIRVFNVRLINMSSLVSTVGSELGTAQEHIVSSSFFLIGLLFSQNGMA
jgi:hypothetical protein